MLEQKLKQGTSGGRVGNTNYISPGVEKANSSHLIYTKK